jgi:hypothetical protein
LTSGIAYSEDEWREAAGHYPLRNLPPEEMALLHRHWMWANQMREAFDRTLTDDPEPVSDGPAMLATRGFGFMLVWYALLWAVIEASVDPKEGRNLDFRGGFRHDIDTMAGTLRGLRNAVLHVPRTNEYVDERLTALILQPDSALAIRRISLGFGRLFLEEFRRRRIDDDGGVKE